MMKYNVTVTYIRTYPVKGICRSFCPLLIIGLVSGKNQGFAILLCPQISFCVIINCYSSLTITQYGSTVYIGMAMGCSAL